MPQNLREQFKDTMTNKDECNKTFEQTNTNTNWALSVCQMPYEFILSLLQQIFIEDQQCPLYNVRYWPYHRTHNNEKYRQCPTHKLYNLKLIILFYIYKIARLVPYAYFSDEKIKTPLMYIIYQGCQRYKIMRWALKHRLH